MKSVSSRSNNNLFCCSRKRPRGSLSSSSWTSVLLFFLFVPSLVNYISTSIVVDTGIDNGSRIRENNHYGLLGGVSALTISTFNILAPVHRSMDAMNTREAEKSEWWRPRTEELASFIVNELHSSDVILLQEWWFNDEFVQLFQSITGHLFDIVAERRPTSSYLSPSWTPASPDGTAPSMREDGMAVMIRKEGKLELIDSKPVITGPQRIAQLVRFRERPVDRRNKNNGKSFKAKNANNNQGRIVHVANVHLSFPCSSDPIKSQRRQAFELQLIARELKKARKRVPWVHATTTATADDSNTNNFNDIESSYSTSLPILEFLGGDFNSNSNALAAKKMERNPFIGRFVSCASASSQQSFVSGSGGEVDLGVTHRTHRGEDVSVDHIFARSTYYEGQTEMQTIPRRKLYCPSLLRLGYLDSLGTRISDCRKKNLKLLGEFVLSDHRPVTARIEFPMPKKVLGAFSNNNNNLIYDGDDTANYYLNFKNHTDFMAMSPLDPLESPLLGW